MRSIIDEIARAEAQADEIRQSAAAEARENALREKAAAEAAYAAKETEAREKLRAALEQAETDGAKISETLLAESEAAARALCAEAETRLDDAVAYLMKRVQGA